MAIRIDPNTLKNARTKLNQVAAELPANYVPELRAMFQHDAIVEWVALSSTLDLPVAGFRQIIKDYEERRRREIESENMPPLGPRMIFTVGNSVITYEIEDASRIPDLQTTITNILTANPAANLFTYAKDLNIRLIRIDRKPEPIPKTIKGFNG